MLGGPLLYFGAELLHRHTGERGREDFLEVLHRELRNRLAIAREHGLERLDLLEFGFFSARAGTRSRQYITWVYIGGETQSVPSWSKVAMRSSGGTNFGLPCSVVARTKSTMACLAGPSFHEGSGSWARATT